MCLRHTVRVLVSQFVHVCSTAKAVKYDRKIQSFISLPILPTSRLRDPRRCHMIATHAPPAHFGIYSNIQSTTQFAA
jgi:hypothetical protein